MEINYSDTFLKQYAKADKKIQIAVKKRIALFENNIYHPLLHNHALTGQLSGYRSINITGDWRALHHVSGNRICFDLLGTHSDLYQ